MGDAAEFQIELRFTKALTPEQQAIVVLAAQRWVKIVKGPSSAIQESGNAKLHGLAVDVTAAFGKKGGVVATTRSVEEWLAGPLAGLPRVARIEFDTADLDDLETDGRLVDVAIHEVGHAFGFGIVWRDRKLVAAGSDGGPVFRGAEAMAEYARLHGAAASLPVPIDRGSGKTDNHWAEKTFGAESMTSVLQKGSQPVSRLTVASLQEIGYVVSFEGADAFALPTK